MGTKRGQGETIGNYPKTTTKELSLRQLALNNLNINNSVLIMI